MVEKSVQPGTSDSIGSLHAKIVLVIESLQ